jgi:predicted Zn-dependent protease
MYRILFFILVFVFLGFSILQLKDEKVSGLSSESLTLWASKPFLNLSGLFKKGTEDAVENEDALRGEILKSFDHVDRDKKLEKKLNKLNDKLTLAHNPKNLKWTVIVTNYGFNASAYPGGIIVISKDLVEALHEESYIVAVLAHERGHVDLGHCYNYYKSKFKVGKLFYSKLQEEQADDYSFEFLIRMGYNPLDLSKALKVIQANK